jgi:hypothetical protein
VPTSAAQPHSHSAGAAGLQKIHVKVKE